MSEEPERMGDLIPVCDACLKFRLDVDAAWLAGAAEGKKRTQYWCDDDLAFPALESVTAATECPHCGRSSQVIPIDQELARRISIFRGQLE
jgi:hypothetical protein